MRVFYFLFFFFVKVARGEPDEDFAVIMPEREHDSVHWKKMIGTEQVSKTTVDARTQFCVTGLVNTVTNDSRCLRRLEMLCAHLHQYPYAKVERDVKTCFSL